jgi:MFS family permease
MRGLQSRSQKSLKSSVHVSGIATGIPEQRWIRILPVTFIMYTIAFVDRTNVSLALPRMSVDLHMDPAQAGAASGIFFIGYVLLQIPAGYLASRWSPKWLIGILLVAWGFCSAATGLVHSWREFLVVRFLLGLTEAGVWPAALVLISRWFPRSERARANAYWMLCLPAAAVLSSPISGWILDRWNWRVLLVSEGLLPILWMLFWMALIDDSPDQSSWITHEEREYLRRMQQENRGTEPRQSWLSLVFRPSVLILLLISFLISTGNYGFLFWLPSVLQSVRLGTQAPLSQLQVGFLNAIPYITAALGMVLISRRSDRRQERLLHVAASLAWAGTLLLASVFAVERSPALAFGLLCLATVGSFGMLGPFWSIPTELLPTEVAGAAIGLIQLSNLGGAIGPLLVGLLQRQTGSFKGSFEIMALGWWVGAGLCLSLKQRTQKPLTF